MNAEQAVARPLLNGEIRSAFAMTGLRWPPATPATSDHVLRDSTTHVINGRKWWISGAADPAAAPIVMGRTSDAASHWQQSMILVPSTPGVSIERSLPVLGGKISTATAKVNFEACGCGWESARRGGQRLRDRAGASGPRPHHTACDDRRGRAGDGVDGRPSANRIAFGKPLAERGVVQQPIALSATRSTEPSAVSWRHGLSTSTATRASKRASWCQIKAVAPQVACDVIDRAIQVHGAAGISDDFPLAQLYGWHRAMRLFDGPDEVHMRTIARAEVGREKSAFAAAVTS
jgi:acyl-CoA dehydrogenase